MGIAGILSDDIDHSIDRISAPYSAAWSADHFDTTNVFQRYILLVPENAGKRIGIHAAPVDQDQDLIRINGVEAANADGPAVSIDLGHIDSRRHTEDVRYVGCARVVDILLRDYENRRAGFRQCLLFLRDRRDSNGHQVFDT